MAKPIIKSEGADRRYMLLPMQSDLGYIEQELNRLAAEGWRVVGMNDGCILLEKLEQRI